MYSLLSNIMKRSSQIGGPTVILPIGSFCVYAVFVLHCHLQIAKAAHAVSAVEAAFMFYCNKDMGAGEW